MGFGERVFPTLLTPFQGREFVLLTVRPRRYQANRKQLTLLERDMQVRSHVYSSDYVQSDYLY